MNLSDVLWSNLDLSKFGSLIGVELFGVPQFIDYHDIYNPLNYGIGIHYSDGGINSYCIAHAFLDIECACCTLWNIYTAYHEQMNTILGVTTMLSNVNPSDLPQAFPEEVVELYGRSRV